MRDAILLDTNLLILFAVGTANRKYISQHKRLVAYDEQDFDVVRGILSDYRRVIFTPNVLTETSNFVRYAPTHIRAEIAETLAKLVRNAEEIYIESRLAIERFEYERLGITDSVLLVVSSTGATILTDDLDLYLAASAESFSVINYNHLKELRKDYTE